MWVHDLGAADQACGGKAAGLARLIAAGVPVPAGFVIDGGAFRAIVGDLDPERADIGHVLARAAERIASAEIPRELADEVRERAAELGSLVMVRSSATIEDGAAGAAAGVFSSQRGVPVAEVWDAIRAVWASALTPLAAAYARRRGGRIEIGVIVQELVVGMPMTVYTRPPGAPGLDELMVQRGDQVSRHSRSDLPREIEAQHASVLALRAEAAIGAAQGADVELVQLRKQHGFDLAMQTWVVQARPIVHPTPSALVPPPPAVLAALQDGRRWTWDVAHNPEPLSPAQQGLVERVADIGPWTLRVVAGFLYSSPNDTPRPVALTKQELCVRAADAEARCERALAGDGPPLDRYVAFYRIWAGELAPMIATARAVLPAELRAAGHDQPDALAASLIGGRPSAIEVMLAAAARGELSEDDVAGELGCLASAWDVAAPTFGERPGMIRDAIGRARRADELAVRMRRPTPSMLAAEREAAAATGEQPRVSATMAAKLAREAAIAVEHEAAVELARAAYDLAERDDQLFARAQWIMRKALLARGAELGIGDDIFWIPLGDPSTDVDDLRRRASGARAAAARAAQWRMPLVVGGAPAAEMPALRGVGTGPRVSGRVVRFASLASAISVGHGDVVVTRAVTPALAVVVAGCAALVSETGGLLDHGAALARELGVPCVVGCRDAWSLLSDGMLVTVDGDGGAVTIQSSSS
jgi:rifampicin phosphotransferase